MRFHCAAFSFFHTVVSHSNQANRAVKYKETQRICAIETENPKRTSNGRIAVQAVKISVGSG